MDNSGERSGMSKLKNEDVIEIRRLFSSGEKSIRVIGEHFNVNAGTIRAVVIGKTWRHLL